MTVDLYSKIFWIFLAISVFLMVPLESGTARKWVFAVINLLFVTYHLIAMGGWQLGINVFLENGFARFCVPICIILFSYIGLRCLACGYRSVGILTIGGVTVLILFLIHKLHLFDSPNDERPNKLQPLNKAMLIIGFSYIALRIVDVARAIYSGRQKSPGLIDLINYLIPFHMLAAGPIQSYDDFVAQPKVPEPLGIEEALRAVERIVKGLFKKFILAAMIQRYFLTDFRATGPYFFVEMQLMYLWLYLDFSAYSDIAVGIGKLIGVGTPENFNNPLIARNPIDYWERWHISLSQFIRRNLFLPIQIKLMRQTEGHYPLLLSGIAFMISFLVCGIWHDISFNWLAWGFLQALGLIVCTLYRAILLHYIGRKGLKIYMENRWIHAVSVVLTFEFMALTIIAATYPLENLSK